MHQRMRFFAVAFGAACLVVSASATTITTTAYGVWDTSAYITAGSASELNFTSIQNKSYASGLTLDALSNSSIGFAFTGPSSGSSQLTGTEVGNVEGLQAAFINIAPPAGGENAVFLYIVSSGTITVALSDGSSLSGGSGFFGFSLSHPVTSISVTTTSGQVFVGDFDYGTSSLTQDANTGGGGASPTPEAATFLLTCGGLCLLLGTGRKLSQRFAT